MDDEETQFQQKFLTFPSSFSLEIEELKKIKHRESEKKKLELKCALEEPESTTERTRLYNLLTFLHWMSDENDKAYEYNSKALEQDRENIVALCNRVWMKRKDGDLTEAKEELDQIEKLADSKRHLVLQGKAEIAYSYSVFGPHYFKQSINIYDQLLSDTGIGEVNAKVVLLWKLDLGIIYRKYCNYGNILPSQGWKETNRDECIKRAAALFHEVIISDSPVKWKGRCFASLAEFSFSISTGTQVKRSQNELFPKELANKDVETLLNLALETCSEDAHVLKVCGKLFKYLNNLDKAEEVLTKSLTIRETSYGHHHLAMVLKKKLWNRIRDAKGGGGQRNIRQKQGAQISNSSYVRKDTNYSHQLSTKSGNEKHGNLGVTYSGYASVGNENSLYQQNPRRNNIRQSYPSSSLGRANSPEQAHLQKKATSKSFVGVFSIPDNEKETFKQIVHHLDKAVELGNEWASFEKGLILRQVNEVDEAFKIFIQTLKHREFSTTMVTVSCYEQLGICRRDLARREEDPEKKRKLDADAVKYFQKAIERIACQASQELNYLKDDWMAYPTLKSMLQAQERDVAKLKVLVDTSKMLKLYGESFNFYNQILQLDETQAKDPKLICEIIQILLDNRQFTDAAVLLDLQNCTEAKNEVSKEFCKLVYLKCAFDLVSSNQKENAGERFRQAFSIDCTEIPREQTDFDIFFLYDEEIDSDETGSWNFAKKLENFVEGNCGLRITSNSDKVKPGTWKRTEQTQQMESSIHIVLILDINKPGEELEYFIKIAQEIVKEKKSKLSLILIDDCTCPRELTAFLRMKFDTKLLKCENDFIGWIHKLFFHLIGVHKSED